MNSIRTQYLQDAIEFIDNESPHALIIGDKEYVQVVRCKDCKYWETVIENAEYGLCRGRGNYSLHTRARNFYCADGEMEDKANE